MIRKKGFPLSRTTGRIVMFQDVARGLQPFGKLAAIRHAGSRHRPRHDGNTELGEVFQAGLPLPSSPT